ncbi:CBS domain-containing protein [Halalkaliarchaeum sp. AArc-GB]|uniref:CBS domain-containing protein n=1 Tax=Halalkaliarchaeum sp. AArc-GB TaxID=3074078 RepID=UPI0028657BF7|nr:CBS domain-containing protein [Halalkaliarchaeum sp. AArc-GB]MDR5673283.1 CBS domain-containing protein [Halalkaliarchaeum sp. AArc-GB]
MTVQYIARTDVVTVSPDASVEEVATTMRDRHIGSVVVTEGDEPVGIVTDRDVGIGIWEFDDLRAATVADVMTTDPVTVESNATIYEGLQTAREAGVRRIPITEDGDLVGIFTIDDVLVLIGGELGLISEVVQSHSPPYEE